MLLASLLTFVLVFPGCSGSDNHSALQTSPATSAAGPPSAEEVLQLTDLGSVEGFVSRSGGREIRAVQSGTLEVGSRPGQPIQGAAVGLEGTDLQVRTDARGFFHLTSVPAGSRTLVVQSGSETLRSPVTVVANTTVTTGAGALTREQALARVRSALGERASEKQLLITGTWNLIPARAVVSEETPEGPRTTPVRLTTGAWLFLVDSFSDRFFGHPCQYALVEDGSGRVTLSDQLRFPTVNGSDLWSTIDERFADALQVPTEVSAEPIAPRAASPVGEAIRYHAYPCPGTVYGLLVSGGQDAGMLNKLSLVSDALGGNVVRMVPDRVAVLGARKRTDTSKWRQVYQQKFQVLNRRMTSCDTLVIYVTGHVAAWLDRDNRERSMGYLEFAFSDISSSLFISVADLVEPIITGGIRCCHVVFVIESCKAGSLIDNENRSRETGANQPSFTTYVNRGLNSRGLVYPEYLDVGVLTSTDGFHLAENNSNALETFVGNDFTETLVKNPLFAMITPHDLKPPSEFTRRINRINIVQEPRSAFFPALVGCLPSAITSPSPTVVAPQPSPSPTPTVPPPSPSPGPSPSLQIPTQSPSPTPVTPPQPSPSPPVTPPQPSPSPTPPMTVPRVSVSIQPARITFEHSIGVTPCPQKVGQFTFTSAGSATVSITGNDPTGTVSFSPNPLTLAPGEQKSVDVFFRCTTTNSFSTDVTFTASSGPGGDFEFLKGTVLGVLR